MERCKYIPYDLPEVSFFAGDSQRFEFPVFFASSGAPFILEDCMVFFSIMNSLSIGGDPDLLRAATIEHIEDCDIIKFVLASEDSRKLCGRYIYQITVIDTDGERDMKQGLMTVYPGNGTEAENEDEI